MSVFYPIKCKIQLITLYYRCMDCRRIGDVRDGFDCLVTIDGIVGVVRLRIPANHIHDVQYTVTYVKYTQANATPEHECSCACVCACACAWCCCCLGTFLRACACARLKLCMSKSNVVRHGSSETICRWPQWPEVYEACRAA